MREAIANFGSLRSSFVAVMEMLPWVNVFLLLDILTFLGYNQIPIFLSSVYSQFTMI